MTTSEEAIVIRVYLSRGSAASTRVQGRLPLLQRALKNATIEVIDVDANPGAADRAGISRTPTLFAQTSACRMKLVGEFHDTDTVLRAIGVAV